MALQPSNTTIRKLNLMPCLYKPHPSQVSLIQTQNNNNSRKIQHPQNPTSRKQETKMISARKLIKMARKWQRVAVLRRKRISFPKGMEEVSTSGGSSEVGEKGHFIVYTTDGVRFSFPISYLGSLIFRELLRLSEDEFGLPSDGPITLPCDSQFLRYLTALMEKKPAKDVERALSLSMAACRCSSSYYLHQSQETSHVILSGC